MSVAVARPLQPCNNTLGQVPKFGTSDAVIRSIRYRPSGKQPVVLVISGAALGNPHPGLPSRERLQAMINL